MIEYGEDILWVSNMLGHTDSSMTLQMYAKYRKRENVKRGSFLEDKLDWLFWAQFGHKYFLMLLKFRILGVKKEVAPNTGISKKHNKKL